MTNPAVGQEGNDVDSTVERIDDTSWEGRHTRGEFSVLSRYTIAHGSMLERYAQYARAGEVVRESCANWRLTYRDGELIHPESGKRVGEFVRSDHDTAIVSAFARTGSLPAER